MKTILVTTDFTETSQNAENYAAELAGRAGAKLTLINIYLMPVMAGEMNIVMPGWEDMEENCIALLQKSKERIKRAVSSDLEIECVYRTGFTVSEIIKSYTKENKTDLVVMGMEGGGYLNEKLIGSHTTGLIKTSVCDVLVIHKQVKFSLLKNIVFACDYLSVPEKSTFNLLRELAELFRAHVLVLNIIDSRNPPSLENAVAANGIKNLIKGIDASFHSVENDDIMEGINSFASEKNADMIVLIHHHYNLFDNIFHKSNTKRMAFHSSIPLLALHE